MPYRLSGVLFGTHLIIFFSLMAASWLQIVVSLFWPSSPPYYKVWVALMLYSLVLLTCCWLTTNKWSLILIHVSKLPVLACLRAVPEVPLICFITHLYLPLAYIMDTNFNFLHPRARSKFCVHPYLSKEFFNWCRAIPYSWSLFWFIYSLHYSTQASGHIHLY